MSEIINGKEALIALANGENVESKKIGLVDRDDISWLDTPKTRQLTVLDFISGQWSFRLKPRTISINGIETPAHFEPNDFEDCYMLTDLYEHGYTKTSWKYSKSVPAWRTEDEIKQVVSALRSIFKGEIVK